MAGKKKADSRNGRKNLDVAFCVQFWIPTSTESRKCVVTRQYQRPVNGIFNWRFFASCSLNCKSKWLAGLSSVLIQVWHFKASIRNLLSWNVFCCSSRRVLLAVHEERKLFTPEMFMQWQLKTTHCNFESLRLSLSVRFEIESPAYLNILSIHSSTLQNCDHRFSSKWKRKFFCNRIVFQLRDYFSLVSELLSSTTATTTAKSNEFSSNKMITVLVSVGSESAGEDSMSERTKQFNFSLGSFRNVGSAVHGQDEGT